MEGITYRKLRDALNELSDEELDMTATVSDGPVGQTLTEYFPIFDLDLTGEEETDILDANHPVLVSDF